MDTTKIADIRRQYDAIPDTGIKRNLFLRLCGISDEQLTLLEWCGMMFYTDDNDRLYKWSLDIYD